MIAEDRFFGNWKHTQVQYMVRSSSEFHGIAGDSLFPNVITQEAGNREDEQA